MIIDVREPDEFASGHVKGAVNIPLAKLIEDNQLAKAAKDTKILLYCNSGNRSGVAKGILGRQGFTNVTNAINQQTLEANHLNQ